MKKIIVLIFLLAITFGVQAQKRNVVSAYNYSKPKYNQLDKAVDLIDIAVKNEKTATWAKAWYYRGMIYQRLAESKKASFRNYRKKPLFTAIVSYNKAIEFDKKGRYKKDVMNLLKSAIINGYNNGVKYLKAQQPDSSFHAFADLIYGASDKTIPAVAVDSSIYYYAGLAAQQAKLLDTAINMYQKSIDIQKNAGHCYLLMANIYLQKKDTTTYVAKLKEGLSKAKDNYNLMLTLIDYYNKKGLNKEALEYIHKAIAKDSTNAILYFAQGNIYSSLKQADKALASYNKAIEIDPKNVNVIYNLGTLFFNKAADISHQMAALSIDENDKYEKLKMEEMEQFKTSAIYFEKARVLDSKDISILKSLKQIYFNLRNEDPKYADKLKEVKDKIANFKK